MQVQYLCSGPFFSLSPVLAAHPQAQEVLLIAPRMATSNARASCFLIFNGEERVSSCNSQLRSIIWVAFSWHRLISVKCSNSKSMAMSKGMDCVNYSKPVKMGEKSSPAVTTVGDHIYLPSALNLLTQVYLLQMSATFCLRALFFSSWQKHVWSMSRAR